MSINEMKILAVGDVVGPEAVAALSEKLRKYKSDNNICFTVVNGENASVGNGIDTQSAKQIIEAGADVITTGNHVWKKRDIRTFLDDSSQIVRPVNYPSSAPGNGYTKLNIDGYIFLVINVLGTVYLEPLDNPFMSVSKVLANEEGKYDFAVLDIHAEATSEKIALANYFDGRINIIFGTHTHVTTADERIFPRGTGYITDLGMSGPVDSVLGVKTDCIIEKFTTMLPVRFELASGDIEINGAVFTLDTSSGRITDVRRVKI